MWPSNHEDKITLKEKWEIRKLPIVDAQGINAAGLGVSTRKNNAKVEVSLEHSIEDTNTKLVGLLEALCQGLNSPEAIDIIEETRVILDFATLAQWWWRMKVEVQLLFLNKFP